VSYAMTTGGGTVAVIGGGITGAFAAYFLARRGLAPVIVEREGIGAQASGNNHGGLNPLHGPGIPGAMEAVSLEAFRLHLEHQTAIRELSGHDVTTTYPVRIHVAMTAADDERLETLHAIHERHTGFSARWLPREELLALEPRLSVGVRGGLWTQGSARVEAFSYTRAVAAAAEAIGARTVKADAVSLDGRRGRASAVILDSAVLPCDAVVIASGAWAAEPAAWLGARIPVEPVKGELLYADVEPGLEYEIVWREWAAYGSGRSVCLGGTRERAGFDPAPTAAARASILAGVETFLPGLNKARIVRQTAALRPLTPDGLSIVGCPHGWDNVCLALGGGEKGMLLSAAMGRLSADVIASGGVASGVDAWSPRRFEEASRHARQANRLHPWLGHPTSGLA
jgi:glycine/D-amino acid oxidase-like deaminating enzyme